jgi:glucose/mannose-6-phosphate isomerase
MLVPVIVACEKLKLIHAQNLEAAFDLLDECAKEWTVEAIDNPTKQLARKLHGALPIIYGLGTWQGLIANRWRSQINENAKELTFFNSFPELNHNEILGWVEASKLGVSRYAGVILEDGTESAKMKKRAEVSESLIGEICPFVHVQAKGHTLIQKLLSLAFFGDFVSIYLARLNEVDPENIDWLVHLKDELGKIA